MSGDACESIGHRTVVRSPSCIGSSHRTSGCGWTIGSPEIPRSRPAAPWVSCAWRGPHVDGRLSSECRAPNDIRPFMSKQPLRRRTQRTPELRHRSRSARISSDRRRGTARQSIAFTAAAAARPSATCWSRARWMPSSGSERISGPASSNGTPIRSAMAAKDAPSWTDFSAPPRKRPERHPVSRMTGGAITSTFGPVPPGPALAGPRDFHQNLNRTGDIFGRDREPCLEVVGAEHDDEDVDRTMALEDDR